MRACGWPHPPGPSRFGRYDAGLEILSAARRPRLATGQDEL